MKSIFEHVEYIKGKPHHIRQKIAFGVAAGATAFIALVWLAGSLGSGAFAITGSSVGDQISGATTGERPHSGLAGAAAALPSVTDSAPARIEIVDTASSSGAVPKKSDQTVLPF